MTSGYFNIPKILENTTRNTQSFTKITLVVTLGFLNAATVQGSLTLTLNEPIWNKQNPFKGSTLNRKKTLLLSHN